MSPAEQRDQWRAASQAWRARNPERVRELKKAQRSRRVLKLKLEGRTQLAGRQRALRTLVDLYKARPCSDCGGSFPACCMDLDHRPGVTKLGAIGALVQTATASALFDEIAKCDLVCANCHRLRTNNRARGLQ